MEEMCSYLLLPCQAQPVLPGCTGPPSHLLLDKVANVRRLLSHVDANHQQPLGSVLMSQLREVGKGYAAGAAPVPGRTGRVAWGRGCFKR